MRVVFVIIILKATWKPYLVWFQVPVNLNRETGKTVNDLQSTLLGNIVVRTDQTRGKLKGHDLVNLRSSQKYLLAYEKDWHVKGSCNRAP